MVIADPEQIRRVVNNIISNSCKYFDKSQCFINMRIKDVGDFIQVEIEDNGKGIATKDIPYIFDRFTALIHRVIRQREEVVSAFLLCARY